MRVDPDDGVGIAAGRLVRVAAGRVDVVVGCSCSLSFLHQGRFLGFQCTTPHLLPCLKGVVWRVWASRLVLGCLGIIILSIFFADTSLHVKLL